MAFLNKFFGSPKKSGDSKRKKKFGWNKIFSLSEISDDFYEKLEEQLIAADTGGKNSLAIIEKLRQEIERNNIKTIDRARAALKNIIKNYFYYNDTLLTEDKLNVFIIIGVNGVGKTTSIAKLAAFYAGRGDVVLGAADTFRAAAREQLEYWGRELGAQVIAQPQGSDAASVAYDTVHSALTRGKKFAIIDTAGRLQNKNKLVDQLLKLSRVVDKYEGKINKKIILVLDATLGQSGYEQVRIFKEKVGTDGIIMTKLDTQARGGVLISIAEKLKIPILFFTHGEKIDQLSKFNVDEYLDSII
ncbi:MAG TPA: signal recognition particle-docking protein FtsY [Spirochaetota bacterium]|nr:signal recognition particle-docking protein FtsY [Spirochaetota bacterium]